MGTVHLNDASAPLRPGADLLGQMLDGGLPAMYLCMSGNCGRCKVQVVEGAELLGGRTRAEEHHRCGPDQRLACQVQVVGDGTLRVRQ